MGYLPSISVLTPFPPLALGTLIDLGCGGDLAPMCVKGNEGCISCRTIPEKMSLIVRHRHMCNSSSPPFLRTERS